MESKESLQKKLKDLQKVYSDIEDERDSIDVFTNTPSEKQRNEKLYTALYKVFADINATKKLISDYDFEIDAKLFEKKWNVRIPRGDEYITSPSDERWKNADLTNFK